MTLGVCIYFILSYDGDHLSFEDDTLKRDLEEMMKQWSEAITDNTMHGLIIVVMLMAIPIYAQTYVNTHI